MARLSRDLSGQRFGLLSVLRIDGRDAHGNLRWRAKCDCGAEKVVRGTHLSCGKGTKSCGCLKRLGGGAVKHGMSSTSPYSLWRGMVDRCTRPGASHYDSYGGRGIQVCDRWMTFENFFRDMGERPAGTSLDRIDNDGNYEPGNCRWATFKQQHRNKRTNRLLEFRGVTQCLTDWAAQLGMATSTLEKRLDKGWSVAMAFETPINRNLSRSKK